MYRVTEADILRSLSAQVTASRGGYTSGVATASAVTVPKVPSTTTASSFGVVLKPSQRGKLSITVASPGIPRPTGTIVIKDGRKKLKKLTLKAKKIGKLTVRLPRLRVGRHKIKVIYKGNSLVKRSRSKVIRITVKR